MSRWDEPTPLSYRIVSATLLAFVSGGTGIGYIPGPSLATGAAIRAALLGGTFAAMSFAVLVPVIWQRYGWKRLLVIPAMVLPVIALTQAVQTALGITGW